ncbi:TIGR01459 family HAD-type hydrolase [Rhodobacter calidifons]|uniref:TIGR01459 family HAD-type hydrolase n=1 Tax=Rhodobacter calidifons TaxID=2715277 RepID=A0ABX0G5X7_9RHOB|nr:TIGR01459 family HAD-type hydrolase [Rhodobacter calidifons]NHB76534.1 TIGR01459 family HAD-type hydrolase [Rhodobacter calidifons]
MTDIIRSLSDLTGRYDAVFCDLWGCLHNGQTAYPAAVSALQAFRSTGGRVVLLTNAPRPKSSVIRQLDGLGVPRDAYDLVVTSGDAAQMGMLSGAVGRRVHHIGAPKDEVFFTDFAEDLAAYAATQPPITRVPLRDAEGIVCTGLRDDLTETPDDYRASLLLGKTLGLPMLCANPDIIVDMGDKRLYCAGALAKAYEDMGGTALYFGKPHPPIYDLARRRLAETGLTDAQILCIGDGIFTDIQGGIGEGLDTLFITGGLEADRFGPDVENPDPARLDAWLGAKELSPTFAMGRLR